MTKKEMIEVLYDELVSNYECADFYGNPDNPMYHARKSHDFRVRANEVSDIATALFGVDLFDRYILETLKS